MSVTKLIPKPIAVAILSLAMVLAFFILNTVAVLAEAPGPIQDVPQGEEQLISGCGGESGESCIIKDIQVIVKFLSAGVGIVVVAMIIIGGIQYTMAGDNPQAVSAAKSRIKNALFGLLAYALTYAFLNWLIPGGVF